MLTTTTRDDVTNLLHPSESKDAARCENKEVVLPLRLPPNVDGLMVFANHRIARGTKRATKPL